MPASDHSLDTKLIHAGRLDPRPGGAVCTPVWQSSTFELHGEGGYHDVRYVRLSNTPGHQVLHRRLAALENAEAALVTASGMSAISAALLALLENGDHLLVQESPYGGTFDLLAQDLPRMGIACDSVPGDDPAAWRARLRPRTRVLYLETLSNPLLLVPDLEAAVAFAREHGLHLLVDNTFPSPVNFRPAEWGVDLSLHSATKYLNGHSDIAAGAVIGSAELVERVRHKLNHLGGSLDPHACFLLERGMKTLALRVRHQNASALELARRLAAHPAVARVHHPGLEDHPSHARARRLLDGFGGMLAFEPAGGLEAAERFLARVELAVCAPSLGGPETLVVRPATTSHAGLSREERAAAGIAEELVRVSVGLEDVDDLWLDFERALG